MNMLLSLKQRLSLLLPVTLFVAALPAHAGLVTYTDLNAWTAATSGVTTIGFETLAPANGFKDYSTSTGLLVGNLQFQGFENTASYDLQVVDGTPSWYNFNSGASLKGPSYNAPPAGFVPYIHVILPVNTSAFGVDLMTISPNALTFQVTVAGQSFNVNTANSPTRTFFGVTSDTSIASINFAVIGTTNGAGTYGLMDNFRSGAEATQTPELGSLLLIGSGLIGFRMLRRRRPITLAPLAA
jgi:hypothetical protein